jgi:hypothetical protein
MNAQADPSVEKLQRLAAVMIAINSAKIDNQLNSADAIAAKLLGVLSVDTAALGAGLALREQLSVYWWALMVMFVVSAVIAGGGLFAATFQTGPPAVRDDVIDLIKRHPEEDIYADILNKQQAARRCNKSTLRRQNLILAVALYGMIVPLLVGPITNLLVTLHI